MPNTLTNALPTVLETLAMSDEAQREFVRGDPPQHGFDVVVCSGVLYHVYSPIHLLGHLRSALRPGGLLVLETAAIPLENAYILQYNYAGSGYALGPTDTWLPSVPLLDHLLRFFKFLPLDACWTTINDGMIRFACVARAVDHRPTLPNEVLMDRSAFNLEYAAILREPPVLAVPRPPVRYDVPALRPDYRPGLGSCDLMATVRRRPPMPVNARMVELHLGDQA
jgi:SAM-dependent methyltransferase